MYIHYCISCIYKELSYKSSLFNRLFVVRGEPKEVFPKLFKDWGVTRLTYEVDTEPYAVQRDVAVCKLAEEHGVEVVKCVSHTLYDTQRY